MGDSLQKKVEENVYDILFELENELGIETEKLPEVYYVNKFSEFENLGLNLEIKPFFNKIIEDNSALCLMEEKIILTTEIDELVLGEEVGHYIHYNYLNLKDKRGINQFSFEALSEMLGFFSSKLISSERENPYSSRIDSFPKNSKNLNEIIKKIYDVTQNEEEYFDEIHSQGYSMGEKLFNYYTSDLILKQKVKEIFTNPLDSESEAFYQFLHWKYEILK
ncbi:hypothetical protein HOD29_02285 [archaeon]|jgi:hypothetical protein|nr:hypothetical protein [archaeon]